MSNATMSPPKKKAPAKGADAQQRQTVLTMKGTPEWKAWLEGLAYHLRTPTSTVVDHALVRYAKEVGYGEEPPRR